MTESWADPVRYLIHQRQITYINYVRQEKDGIKIPDEEMDGQMT